MLTPLRMRIFRWGIWVDVDGVLPRTILPFGWLNERTVLAKFKREIVEWIRAKRLGTLVFSLDGVDMNAKYKIATPDTFKNLVSNPSARPGVGSDQNDSYRGIFQFRIN